ncbi:MAG: hypothetical protein K2N23_04670 [Clostridia bacterium]|nr:hypothetical protein [Clostridia bacterium]
MEDKEKPVSLRHRPGLEERLRNTAELLSAFAKENLDKDLADEIINDLSDITKKNND